MQRVARGSRLKVWKTKPISLLRMLRQFVVVHLADQAAVDVVLALRRRIEAADQVHQGRFAGARRPHDRDVLAALDLDIDAGDRVDHLVAHDVGLPDIVRADDDAFALEPLALFDCFVSQCLCHADVLAMWSALTTGGLLSIFTVAPFFMVRITW